jgi:hemolysin activation/secretion protein
MSEGCFAMKKKNLAAMATLLCLVGNGNVLAADMPDVNVPNKATAGAEMQRMQQYLERERVNRQIAEDRAKAKAKVEQKNEQASATEQELSFKLERIATDPSEVLTAAELEKICKPYEGREVKIGDIYSVVEQINRLYTEKGYLTCRAFLPAQKLEKGVVRIRLVEGRTGTASVRGNSYTKSRYITNRLHLAEGEIANIKQVNEDLLRFNAGNATQLRITMKAGSKPGTTDYEITAVEPQQHNWTLFEDNAGSYSGGEYRTGLFYNAKSISGNEDPLTVGTVLSEGMRAANAMYSRSVGRSGTRLNLMYSSNSVKVVKGNYDDQVKGHANAYTIGISQPLLVNETTRTEVSLDYTRQKSMTDFISPRFNIVDDSVQDFALGFALTSYGNSHVSYMKHSYVRGYSESNGLSTNNPDVNFGFYKFNGLYQKAYKHGQMLNLRANAQWSGTEDLVSSRQFYIGGMYSVRGYKESFLGSNSGYVLNAEYHVPLLPQRLTAFGFFDYGYLYGTGMSNDADYILSSVGVGLRSSLGKNCSASLVLGIPLRRDFQEEEVSKTRINFVISGRY